MIIDSLQKIETQDYTIQVIEGVVHCTYHCKIIDLKVISSAIDDRIKISNNIDLPCIAEGPELKYWDKEARAYAAKPESLKHIKALALVTNRPLLKSLVNLFLTFFYVKNPTKIFASKKDALTWAKKHC